ncbi:RING finger protein 145-like isoform X4 [Lepidochelys kempii]|uniref:RING finger protein 145-like isoform X4 n=1 Tax=Lepidochelys kempii TaxID=8472 RepID=UPI003C6EFFB0
MPRLEEVANVALRVPSVVLLDLLYRWDVQAFAELLRPQQEEAPWRRRALWHAYYLGHMLCVGVLLLPVRSLVKLYLYGLTLLLLFVGHQTARDYMRHEMEYEFQGAVYQDPVVLSRFLTALTGQIFVSTLCALLMKTKQVWLFCAPLLPLLARLCGLPLQALPVVNAFATSVTVVEVLYVATSHLLAPFHLAAAVCREMAQGLEMYRLVALAMSLWSQLAIPVLFLVFWLVLFTLQIYSFLASSNSLLAQQGLLFIFLSRSPWKHFRSLSLCLFLLVFPCFMAYKIARFFHMDFWLLILVSSCMLTSLQVRPDLLPHIRVSSCMLTSLQVMGTLFVYALFMIELFQDAPLEKTDEIIYYVNAVSRVLEFLVAVCVVAYGTWESIFGEWSWMGASVIIIHSYFNVWLRAQSGWKSFLLRREAAKKINSLPRATRGQLRDHNDVCAICFQEMNMAVITDCGHFFHTGCLRKWLYVQDTCPMCHQPVKPSATEGPQPAGGERAEPEPIPEEGAPENADAGAAGRARTPDPSRTAEGGESSWQEQENPALAEPSRAGLLPEAVPHGEGEPMDPAQSRTPQPVSRGGCTPQPSANPGRTALLGTPPPPEWGGERGGGAGAGTSMGFDGRHCLS